MRNLAKKKRKIMSYEARVTLLQLTVGRRLAGQLISQLNLWLRHNGKDWTCSRLKSMFWIAVQLRAGDKLRAQEICRNESIAYHHRSLLPKGPFGVVIKAATETRKAKNLRKLFGVLRIFALYTATKESEKDKKKHYESVTLLSGASYTYLSEVSDDLAWVASDYKRIVPGERVPKITDFKPSKGIDYDRYGMSKLGGNAITGSAVYGRYIQSLFTTRPHESFPDILDWWGLENLAELALDQLRTCDYNYTGHLSFICEQGKSPRLVAVPNFWWQFTCKPLFWQLEAVSKSLDVSSAHDQNTGAYFMEEVLTSSKKALVF